MMARMRPVLVAIATASVALLIASCGSSRVVRGPSTHRSTRTSLPPVRVSTPRYGATAVVQRGDTIYHIATVNGLTALDLAGIEVSSGSACTAGVVDASHVLLAMGRSPGDAASALRISLGRTTTPDDVAALKRALPLVVAQSRLTAT